MAETDIIEPGKRGSKIEINRVKSLTIAELTLITNKIDLIDSKVQEIEELNAKIFKKKTIQLGSSIAITLPYSITKDLNLSAKETVYLIQIDKDKLFLYIKK